jgi:hypothetical protein
MLAKARPWQRRRLPGRSRAESSSDDSRGSGAPPTTPSKALPQAAFLLGREAVKQLTPPAFLHRGGPRRGWPPPAMELPVCCLNEHSTGAAPLSGLANDPSDHRRELTPSVPHRPDRAAVGELSR